MASQSFLKNHLLYLLVSLLGVVASRTLAAVDAVSNWWHAAVCALLSLFPKARVRFPVNRPDGSGGGVAVLVTGTSSGIGHDTAVALASRGYTVFAGVRSWEDGARVESDFLAATGRASTDAVVNGGAADSDSESSSADSSHRQAEAKHKINGTDSSQQLTEARLKINGAVAGPRRLRRMRRRHAVASPPGFVSVSEAGSSSSFGSGSGCIIPVILDVISRESVDLAYARVASELLRRKERLVGVVNNAGVTAFGPMDISAPSFVAHCMDVNFHGPVRVTQTFMPLLRASSGRIVN
ncbi:hypothetical protein IWW38_004664, partial [Coemansia aciculifera]